ncbi:MAG: hypothetical protein ABEH64_00800 [Salinirussus sp.]
MASEGSGSGGVEVDLDPELDEWLEARAEALDVPPAEILVQLLSAYRSAAELDGVGLEVDPDDAHELLRPTVERTLAEALQDGEGEASAALRSTIEKHVQQSTAGNGVSDEQLDAIEQRIEEVGEDFQAKLEDVRSRVIQVKRELDAAREAGEVAKESNIRENLERMQQRLTTLDDRLSTVEETVETVQGRAADGSVEERLETIEDRLQTLAWIVKDLRDAEDSAGTEALSSLKQQAAAADVDRAKCGNCGEGIEIGLLMEPACPHCRATLADLETGRGFFRSAKLQTAAQLEAGEES